MDAKIVTYREVKTKIKKGKKWIQAKEKVQSTKSFDITDITLNHAGVPMTFFLGEYGEIKIFMSPVQVRHLLIRLMIDAMWKTQ